MPDTTVIFNVNGPAREEVQKRITSFFEREFNCTPEIQRTQAPLKNSGKKDFVGAASLLVSIVTLLISIPSAVLASRDLMDRMDKKKKLEALIDEAKKLHEAYPETDITITTQEGAITLHGATAAALLEKFDI